MPELAFFVLWPDGKRMACKSPSTALRRHLPPATYDLPDFLTRARAGLRAASERVREVYGSPCAQAAAQLRAIEAEARALEHAPASRVTVEFS